LAEAEIKVEEIPGSPGSYNAVAWLRPWLQLEELTTSLRMVAKIPAAAKGG
jgi:type VI secretion system protein ImpC